MPSLKPTLTRDEVREILKEWVENEASKKDEAKAVLKEALKEWLDEQFSKLGRWSFYGFMSMTLAAIVYFILKTNGWTHNG